MVVAMASAAGTCVWRSWQVMENVIFRAVQLVLGQTCTYVMIMCI